MVRPKENVLAKLREQMEFLRSSLRGFYAGEFSESVRIATIVRVLVYESGMCKPLLKQARPNGLELPILNCTSGSGVGASVGFRRVEGHPFLQHQKSALRRIGGETGCLSASS